MGALRLLKVDYIRYRGDLKIDLNHEKVEVGFKLKVRSHGLKYNCFMLSFTAGQLLGATARAYPLAATSSFLFLFHSGAQHNTRFRPHTQRKWPYHRVGPSFKV